MLRRTTLCTLAVFAAGASVANAGTIRTDGINTIYYDAAPGEANFVTVNWGNVAAGPDFIPKLDDHADIRYVAPCTVDDLGAYCPTVGPNPRFIVHLGDGNDFGQSINDHAAGHSVVL